jgi:hypothetical protein
MPIILQRMHEGSVIFSLNHCWVSQRRKLIASVPHICRHAFVFFFLSTVHVRPKRVDRCECKLSESRSAALVILPSLHNGLYVASIS